MHCVLIFMIVNKSIIYSCCESSLSGKTCILFILKKSEKGESCAGTINVKKV